MQVSLQATTDLEWVTQTFRYFAYVMILISGGAEFTRRLGLASDQLPRRREFSETKKIFQGYAAGCRIGNCFGYDWE